MNKTLTISALALAIGGFWIAAGQAQESPAPADGIRPVQEAHWRGENRDGWRRHGGRHERGHHDRRGGRDGDDRGGHDGDGRGMRRMLETFDADKDGAVTQAEIDQFRQGQITQFDANKDGTLSLDEYQALWLDQMRERMVDAFQEHDDDGNGQVTAEEFNERFSGLVERLDRNGDGRLSQDDRGRRGDRQDGPAEQEDGDAPAPGTTPPPAQQQ